MFNWISSFALIVACILFAIAAANADQLQGKTTHCDYKYMGVDFTVVDLMIYENGEPASSADVQMYGRTTKVPVTREVKAEGEDIHVWLDKDRPGNEVEMIVYKDRQPEGDSKLTNHNVPIGQDVWGECTGEL